MSWETVTLEDVCDISNGSTPLRTNPQFWENGSINWFTIEDIRRFGRQINQTTQFVTEKAIEETSLKIVPANTILLCCTASVGEFAIAKIPLAMNQQFNGLILKTDKMLPEYLFYYCSTLKEKLLSVSGSTTINFVAISKLKKITIPLPPLATQQKIVAKLDAIFAEIDKATAAAEANAKNAEALFQSYLTQVFERGGEGWNAYTIKDLIKIRSGDFLPAKNMNNQGDVDVYGGNGISGKHNEHNLSGDNIIIGRVGAKCGNVRLVSGDVWITDNAFYVSEYKKNISKEFLTVVLELKNLRTLANQMAQPVISFSTIKDAELKIPESLEKQVEFLKGKNLLEAKIRIVIDSNIKKSNLLNLLKQSILKQAFSGELVKE